MKKFLAIALLACVSTPAMAADDKWYLINRDNDGITYELLKRDVKEADSARPVFWVRQDASKTPKVRWRQRLSQIRMDCAARTFAMVSSVEYFATGSPKFDTNSTAAFPIPPGSIAEDYYDVMCVPERK